jgi:serine/threonine protein phosphatase PrpC
MIPSTMATLHDNSYHGEDTFLVRDLGNHGFLDVVLDGVTGHGGGEASRSVAEALHSITINSPEDVVAVLQEQNEEFFQVGGGRFLLTTVSVALYLEDRLYIINAGDSPVYHVDAGSHKQLAGRIGGLLRAGNTKVIGGEQELAISRSEITIKPGDRLVLATDGITDNIRIGELAEVVRGAASPEESLAQVKGIIDQRLKEGRVPEQLGARYRHDDQTAIIRFFSGG